VRFPFDCAQDRPFYRGWRSSGWEYDTYNPGRDREAAREGIVCRKGSVGANANPFDKLRAGSEWN